MSEKVEILSTLLEENGYLKSTSGHGIVWKLTSDESNAAVKSRIEILERKQQFHISKCQIHIDLEKLSSKIKANIKKRIPKLVSWMSYIEPDGKIKTVAEIAPTSDAKKIQKDLSDNRPAKMGTSIGWTVTITHTQTLLTVQFTDAFMIGDEIPSWWAELASAVSEALAPFSLKVWDTRHLREIQLPLAAIGSTNHKAKSYRGPLRALSAVEIPIPLKTTRLDSGIMIETTTEQTTPSDTPIEILEARETSEIWRDIDSKIIQRKAAGQTPAILNQDADLLARIAADPKMGYECTAAFDTMLSGPAASNSLLCMTGAMRIADKKGKTEVKLQLLSDLVRRVSTTYGPIESINPLARIVPETLGDSWATVNPEIAYRAWNAALDQAPQNPRILRKISKLAMATGDLEREIDALLKIIASERRRSEVNQVSERLVTIMATNPEQKKYRTADINSVLERAISTIPDNPKLALGIASILGNNGRHREALSALEEIISAKNSLITPELSAAINLAIARIWHTKENNIKIATSRYIAATPEGIKVADDILAEVEDFFLSVKNTEQAQRILRLRSQQSDPASRLKALERSAKFHADHKNIKLAAPEILELMSAGIIRTWFKEILENFAQEFHSQTASIVTAMLDINTAELSRDEQSQWQLAAARIASSRADLQDVSLKTMQEGRIIPLINQDEAQTVITILLKEKRTQQASEFITCRLSFAQEKETKALLKIIVANDLSSLDGLYENAIAENASRTNDLEITTSRIQRHLSQKRTLELKALVKAHESSLAGSTLLGQLEEIVIDEICKSGNQVFSEILEDMTDRKLSDPAVTTTAKDLFIKTIITSGFIDLGSRLLIKEIRNGNLCITDESVVEELTQADALILAKWHKMARDATDNQEKRLHHTKRCFAIWMSSNERPSILIDLITELGEAGLMTVDKLELMEFLCARDKQIGKWLETLSSFITKSPRDDQQAFIYWGIRVINSRLDNPEMAAEYCLKCWTDRAELDFEDLFTIATLYYLGNSLLNAQSYLLRMLNNPEILQNQSLLLASLDTLSRCRLDRAHFATITQTLLAWSRAGSTETLTDALVNRSIEWQVAGNDDLNHKFIHEFEKESPERLANMAAQIIGKSERSGSSIIRLLASWREQLGAGEQMAKWWEMIGLLNQDRYLGQLKRPSRTEIIYLYARHLFDSDMTRFDSIPIFEALSSENIMDSRSWIPLYSLYEETSSRQKLCAHLEYIIPLIQKDRSLLEQTPFTLESLKNSLKRARGTNHGLFEINFEKAALQKQRDFDVQERAAQMQKAWFAATPAVQIASPSVASGEQTDSEIRETIMAFQFGQSSAQHFDAGAAMALIPEETNEDASQFDEPLQTDRRTARARKSETKNENDDIKTGRVASLDWRELVLAEKVSPGSTERIMTMAFASDIEKHIAVQCAGLMNAEMRALDAWHWQSWRNPETCDYTQSPKERLPDLENMKHYGGALHRLMRLISPILIRAGRRKFLIESKLQELGLPSTTTMTPLDFEHPIIERCALAYFKPHIEVAKIKFIDTPGMGLHVFFDLRTRSVHFDAQWQSKLPRTILAHKIIEIIVSNQRGQSALIDLNPVTDIIPMIDEISSILTSSGLARLQIAFGMQHREISQELRNINKEQLVSLLSVAGKPGMREIKQLQHEIKLKNLATVLASTLDVVGLLESLCGQDLCETAVLTPKSILKVHNLAKDVLILATKLTI